MASTSSSPSLTLNDLGLLLIRLMLAVVFMYHGAGKLFGAFGGPGIEEFAKALEGMNVPMPQVGAWLAALSEFGGGIVLLLGTGTRLAAIPMIFTMLVAFFVGHGGKFPAQEGGGEYALTLAVMVTGLLFTGPGRLTIGALLKK